MDTNIKEAAETLAREMKTQLELFKNNFPTTKYKHNNLIKGMFLEAVLKEIISKWIFPLEYCTGTFYSEKIKNNMSKFGIQNPVQFDGIVYDNRKGPYIQRNSDFIVINPDFCPLTIEIKNKVTFNEKTKAQLNRQRGFLDGHVLTNNNFIVSIEKNKDLDVMGIWPSAGIAKGFSLFNADFSPDIPIIMLFIESLFRSINSTCAMLAHMSHEEMVDLYKRYPDKYKLN